MKQEFVTYGIFYNPLKFMKIKTASQYLNKPAGGLWSSPVDSVWGWKDWCESEDYRQGYGLKFGFKFILKKSAKIFVIDSLSDYLRMPEKYFSTCRYDGKYYIDWEKLCMDYDGFLLTYNGFCETRFIEDCGLNRRGFYSWDCETLLVFSLDIISEIKSLRNCGVTERKMKGGLTKDTTQI